MVEARIRAAGPRDRIDRPAPGTRVTGPTLLAVVDDESLTDGRRSPTRALLRGDAGLVAGIVVASTVDRLPAVCTAVVEMTDPDGTADLTLPQRGEQVLGFLPAGMADDVARDCARALARFEDPELDLVGAGLPSTIRLLPLLELEECTPRRCWPGGRRAASTPGPPPPSACRTRACSRSTSSPTAPMRWSAAPPAPASPSCCARWSPGWPPPSTPDHLTFVLVDFKGGSAFDECAKLPHTVGMVTDLDEHLAERALRCLEAELRYRERLLRDAAAIDLPDYLRKGGEAALPRLLVIIDEFATLKAELPDFIDALVGVAQRGRSLGVHMLLATQRPQGAISDNIRANTNLRIALRVQDANDSRDVIDVSDAAAIPRNAPGRAYVRLGPGEVVAMQSALSTGARNEASQAHVDVAPFVFGPAPRPPEPAPPGDGDGAGAAGPEPVTDLAVLVATIEDAFARTGRPRPRRPWPDPLPGEIDLDGVIDAALAGTDGAPPFTPLGLADDPEAQTQYPMGWNRREGNLIVYGIGGSGTTTALASLVLSLARTCPPDDLHVYALDFGAGELGALDPLPHVGGVLLAGERERQARLIRLLRAELDRRREMGAGAARAEPELVVVVDGWSTFVAEYNDLAGTALWEAFVRVFADGPEVGITTVVAADRAAAVTGTLASLVRQKLALRLADKGDYSNFGVRGSAVPEMVPGRAVVGGTGQVVQIARPAAGVAEAAARLAAAAPAASRPPVRIDTLATSVRVDQLGAAARLGERPWTIPIGVSERTRQPAALVAYQGEHVLVAGPPRSGRSSALLALAAACKAAPSAVRVVAVAGPRSPLGGDPLVDARGPPDPDRRAAGRPGRAGRRGRGGGRAGRRRRGGRRRGRGAGAAGDGRPARPALRGGGAQRRHPHGLLALDPALRRSKLGVLLRPDVDLDGDILGASIPRRAPVAMTTGRGYLAAGGDVELVQLALPGDPATGVRKIMGGDVNASEVLAKVRRSGRTGAAGAGSAAVRRSMRSRHEPGRGQVHGRGHHGDRQHEEDHQRRARREHHVVRRLRRHPQPRELRGWVGRCLLHRVARHQGGPQLGHRAAADDERRHHDGQHQHPDRRRQRQLSDRAEGGGRFPSPSSIPVAAAGGGGVVPAVGDYQLEREIGAGAAGTVWRAHRQGPVSQVVALKRLRAGSGSVDLARLRREARVLTELDHPHIVRVLDVVADGDGVALAMQYAPGGSLEDLLAARRRLAPGEVVAVAAPVADALASAHRRGVLHGDVKPANVLFTSDGEPLLTDFGVARTLGWLTSENVGGTPEYLAPEQLAGAPPDPRGRRLRAGRDLLPGAGPASRPTPARRRWRWWRRPTPAGTAAWRTTPGCRRRWPGRSSRAWPAIPATGSRRPRPSPGRCGARCRRPRRCCRGRRPRARPAPPAPTPTSPARSAPARPGSIRPRPAPPALGVARGRGGAGRGGGRAAGPRPAPRGDGGPTAAGPSDPRWGPAPRWWRAIPTAAAAGSSARTSCARWPAGPGG
jgi:hypothetical protein